MDSGRFAITVEGVHPPGWMFVLALAINAVPWALRETDTATFKENLAEYARTHPRQQAYIAATMREVARLSAEFHV